MSKRSTGRVSITKVMMLTLLLSFYKMQRNSQIVSFKIKEQTKMSRHGNHERSIKNIFEAQISNNQTENALPSSAVNFFTTRRDIYPRKTIKNQKKLSRSQFRSENRRSS
jgi:hypothetical protein